MKILYHALLLLLLVTISLASPPQWWRSFPKFSFMRPRGGSNDTTTSVDSTTTTTSPSVTTEGEETEIPLHEKVQAAMEKLGLVPSGSTSDDESSSCKDGVCTLPTEEERVEEQQPVKENDDEKIIAEEELDKEQPVEEQTDEQTIIEQINGEQSTEEEQNEAKPGKAIEEQMITEGQATEEQSIQDTTTATTEADDSSTSMSEEEYETHAKALSEEFDIPLSVSRAALYACNFSVERARDLIQYEKSAVEQISPESDEVKQLTDEGFEPFMVRRALALMDGNVNDARAVLIAEKEDETMEDLPEEEDKEEPPLQKTISISSDFDPAAPRNLVPPGPKPPTAKPQQLIYSINTSQIQSIVLESPIPVLLDIYAPWCGPCQQLTPALEQIATKSDGMFRLAKLNSDEERAVVSNSCLDVTGLPTLIGIKDGRIINRMTGAPRSEEQFKSFLMEMTSGRSNASPSERETFAAQTTKLSDFAGMAAISFAKREVLQTKTKTYLDAFEKKTPSLRQAVSSAAILDALMKNVIRHPRDDKYRRVKFSNPTIRDKIASHKSCTNILRLAGWTNVDDGLGLSVGRTTINTAPIRIVRKCVSDWIEEKRRFMISEERRQKDERDRLNLDLASNESEDEYDDEEEVDEDDLMHVCQIKLRIQGKKKIHELQFDPDDDTLQSVKTYVSSKDDKRMQFVCASKKLSIDSSNEDKMKMSLRELGLYPSASLVVKVIEEGDDEKVGTNERKSDLKERASQKKRKKGSHTMQSVGIYSKDDNAKAELIDMGGGVWYEHDVSDEEEEGTEKEKGDKEQEEEEEEDDESEE